MKKNDSSSTLCSNDVICMRRLHPPPIRQQIPRDRQQQTPRQMLRKALREMESWSFLLMD